MKNISKCIILFFLLVLASCDQPPLEYELIQPDKTPPGEVEALKGQALPGAVRLNWVLPKDDDFSYLKIKYTDNGKEFEKQSTDTALIIRGLIEREYSFTIQTVDEKNNVSKGTSISLTPKAPIDVVFELEPVVGGLNVNWTMPNSSEFIFVVVSYLNDAGDVVEIRIPVEEVMPGTSYADGYKIQNLSWKSYEVSVRLVLSSGDLSRGVSHIGRPAKDFIVTASEFYSTNYSSVFHDAGTNTIVDGNLANQSVFVGLPMLGADEDADLASFIMTSENGLIALSKLTFHHTRKHENTGDPKADQQYPAAPAHIQIFCRTIADAEWILVKDHTFTNFAAPAVEGNDPDFLERLKVAQEVSLDAPVNCTQVKIVVLTNMYREHGVNIYPGNKDNITLGEIELDAVFVD